MDPYKMSVEQKVFNFKANGVNYDLTMDSMPHLNVYLFYGMISLSGLIVVAALIFTFMNYKIAAVELLLSSQLIYFGAIACTDDNLALYPLSGLKYLAGFNNLRAFDINKNNFKTSFLISSSTFA